ncbi:hypothetical protein SmJEL517_g05218 [Synchytrium microbalum]|uniref:Uncharacterized protein n=1 Tax=Synchytrium microbalum TaxID=1806994 RepID=A0A507C0A0_9FUNG|nr:uncharacterized protein SmJEL517_g05218 [Synchytrium microbalum]TPX31484.1 hypothetical protein SmJEL517_g05218 [Synchytrium microbalum]
MLMDIFFTATLQAHLPSRRTHFHEFMRSVHAQQHELRARREYQGSLVTIGARIAEQTPILALDEFQVTDIADAMILQGLFNSIFKAGGTLVTTSNRRPEGLYENGLNRGLFVPFIKTLQERCEVHDMSSGPDYRLLKRAASTSSQNWFHPTSPSTLTSFESTYTSARGPYTPIPTTLPVPPGRTIEIPLATPTTARFTFAQLFQTPYGASDYTSICQKYGKGGIFIDGFPLLSVGDTSVISAMDVVRRVITFVDVAYEDGTRVVVSASGSIEETFGNVALPSNTVKGTTDDSIEISVRRGGGASSSAANTFVDNMEWSATGLVGRSLATSLARSEEESAPVREVKFAAKRAISRLHEMQSDEYRERRQSK